MHDAVVLGAGIHGLCTAFALRRAGLRRVAVLDAHGPGHERGSSHGATRITRSSYHSPELVRLAIEANQHAWPDLERALGCPLRVPTPGLFFGPPGGAFDDYWTATLASGAGVEAIDADAARRRFPLLRIDASERVLLDHTAAVVQAAATMAHLRRWLVEQGVELRWHTPATALHDDGHSVRVETTGDSLRSAGAVLAVGPWLARVGGTETPPLCVLRQTVGYFDVDAPAGATEAGRFPVWARIGRTADDFVYGLPDHAGSGLKLARHRTSGDADDPDAPAPPADTGALRTLAEERLAAPVRGLRHHEQCLYAMTTTHDLVVERHRRWPRVVTIAACSGHGFKFGPVVGRRAASLLLADRP